MNLHVFNLLWKEVVPLISTHLLLVVSEVDKLFFFLLVLVSLVVVVSSCSSRPISIFDNFVFPKVLIALSKYEIDNGVENFLDRLLVELDSKYPNLGLLHRWYQFDLLQSFYRLQLV